MHGQSEATGPVRQEVGGYRLLDVLGSGGMGTVYRALDGDDHEVALKLLHPGISADPTARDRLRREIATLHRVRGPHVARVLDAEADSADAFIVTELVNGQSLDDSVREHGALDEIELADLADGLADALGEIHRAGVVHRDLKPGNVMLTDEGPILIDFGISQLADDARLTQTGLVTGTPGYVDPAVMRGAAPGHTGDWWGWSAVLLFAATGNAPFGRGPLAAVLGRVETGRPDLDGVPAPIAPVLRRALHPDPDQRLTPQVVRRSLAEFALGREVTVRLDEDKTRVAGSSSASSPSDTGGAYRDSSRDATEVAVPPARPAPSYPPATSAPTQQPTYQATQQRTQQGPRRVPAPIEGGWTQASVTPSQDRMPAVPPMSAGEYSPGGYAPERYAPEPYQPQQSHQPSQWAPMQSAPPAWANLPRARPAVVGAWFLAVIALGVIYPSVTLAVLVVVLAVLGAIGVGARNLRERRIAQGLRRSDRIRTTLASPWYLLSGLLLALPGLALGGLASGVIWGLGASRLPEELVVACAMAAIGLLAWWTPSAASARFGAKTLLVGLAPNARLARIWSSVGALIAVLAAVIALGFGVGVIWDPFPSPPVPNF